MKRWLWLLVLLISGSTAHALDPPVQLGRWVVDSGKLFSRSDERSISDALRTIQSKSGGTEKGAQVAVLTVKSLEGDDIKEFALRTFRAWKLGTYGAGSLGRSNGVLILIVKDSAQVRVEVGTGLEGALNDAKLGGFIRTSFGGAQTTLARATHDLIAKIADEIYREYRVSASVPPASLEIQANGDRKYVLFGIAIFLAGVFGAIWHRRRRMLRYWFGGVLGASSWFGLAVLYGIVGVALWIIVAAGYVLGYFLAALFRQGGDGWLFDPFPTPIHVGGGQGSGLHGKGGDSAGGGADAGADPGLFDGAGEALSNMAPSGDCPDLGGCDCGGF